jgi:hypothetical protein
MKLEWSDWLSEWLVDFSPVLACQQGSPGEGERKMGGRGREEPRSQATPVRVALWLLCVYVVLCVLGSLFCNSRKAW